MNEEVEQLRSQYAHALLTLSELLQDSQILVDRHRANLTSAGWPDSAIDDASTDLLVSLQDAAVRMLFEQDGESVSGVREVRENGR